MNAVFTGGGTGGHLYPAIAVADALRESSDAVIDFVGVAGRLESTIVPKAGYRLHTVRSAPLDRSFSLKSLGTAAINVCGVAQSIGALWRLRPSIVVATGGYVCFPVVLAARILTSIRRMDCRIALLEPNAKPGLTNRLLAPLVDEVWGAFAHSNGRFSRKYVHTGIPVRAALRTLGARAEACSRLGLSPSRRTLLAMGGSQGARSINDSVASLLASGGLPPDWQVVLITGEREYGRVRALLGRDDPAVRPYLDDLGDAYAAADLILARAGASTIGELIALRKPSILVPYPHAAEDHQRHNAAILDQAGAAIMVDDRDLVDGKLGAILTDATSPARLRALSFAAARLGDVDPIPTILARVRALTARMTAP
ncbi:MAG: UDP-N-acetylglucosamine--N-acetylmuramyl-(pentapeptide) pyrophosphoryl-undecaprenol N-acetylglucosamine transferase [Candidatus Eremiobacteraeota bacterium]|nr:UDP-N-acetylglucosamine--N-acetylmuramyl-(pentapeptide) pyrophosphoryl-undecaprenol N-acetylglucosamine transferase [Candidatus Eremiobacteraeota bacterium]